MHLVSFQSSKSNEQTARQIHAALFIGLSCDLLTKPSLAQCCSPCEAEVFFYLGHWWAGCALASPVLCKDYWPLDCNLLLDFAFCKVAGYLYWFSGAVMEHCKIFALKHIVCYLVPAAIQSQSPWRVDMKPGSETLPMQPNMLDRGLASFDSIHWSDIALSYPIHQLTYTSMHVTHCPIHT